MGFCVLHIDKRTPDNPGFLRDLVDGLVHKGVVLIIRQNRKEAQVVRRIDNNELLSEPHLYLVHYLFAAERIEVRCQKQTVLNKIFTHDFLSLLCLSGRITNIEKSFDGFQGQLLHFVLLAVIDQFAIYIKLFADNIRLYCFFKESTQIKCDIQAILYTTRSKRNIEADWSRLILKSKGNQHIGADVSLCQFAPYILHTTLQNNLPHSRHGVYNRCLSCGIGTINDRGRKGIYFLLPNTFRQNAVVQLCHTLFRDHIELETITKRLEIVTFEFKQHFDSSVP